MNADTWRIVELREIRNKKGVLIPIEVEKTTQGLFAASALIYPIINDSQEPTSRGGHLHPKGMKQEIFISLRGISTVELHTPDNACSVVVLDKPSLALVIPEGVWHEVTIPPDGILLVVADSLYRKDEAIDEKPCQCDGEK